MELSTGIQKIRDMEKFGGLIVITIFLQVKLVGHPKYHMKKVSKGQFIIGNNFCRKL